MIINLKLTEVEARHILKLILDNEATGDYNGNKKHYWDRSEKVKTKIYTGLGEYYDKNTLL